MALIFRALFLFGTVVVTMGDYRCFCNYEVELKVLPSTDPTGNPIGYMYEFDCKQILENFPTDPQWIAIAFEHNIGYIEKGPRFDEQTCQGDPSVDDLVTTTPVVITTPGLHTSHVHTSPNHGPKTTTAHTTTTTPTTQMPTTRPTQPATVATTTTTTTTPAPTTQQPATALPTTSSPASGLVAGHTELCPIGVGGHFTSVQSVFAQWGHKCYEFVDKYTSWLVAEQSCTSYGGHLVAIESQAEQDYITGFMLKNWPHAAWIGLHDRNHEEIFEWISGAPMTYTNWTPDRKLTFLNDFEDCVYMDPRPQGSLGMNGGWDDTGCEISATDFIGERHRFVCQYDLNGYSPPPTTTPDPSATTSQAFGDGNINMCPGRLLQNAPHNNIGQHGHYCYELSTNKHTWFNSETLCRNHGGHLTSINNQDEQDFVSAFLRRHSPQHAVWLGLNDVISEGQFEWTSGMPVNYTNWLAGHHDNFQSHLTEDCVALVPYKNNVWDDVPCGYDGILDEEGEVHYALCQYKISSAPLIG